MDRLRASGREGADASHRLGRRRCGPGRRPRTPDSPLRAAICTDPAPPDATPPAVPVGGRAEKLTTTDVAQSRVADQRRSVTPGGHIPVTVVRPWSPSSMTRPSVRRAVTAMWCELMRGTSAWSKRRSQSPTCRDQRPRWVGRGHAEQQHRGQRVDRRAQPCTHGPSATRIWPATNAKGNVPACSQPRCLPSKRVAHRLSREAECASEEDSKGCCRASLPCTRGHASRRRRTYG